MRACSRPEPLPFETAAADGDAAVTTPIGAAGAFESEVADGSALVAAGSIRLPPAN
jgi:hypothetical protein